MSSWEFMERRRGWTIEKIAQANKLQSVTEFQVWCESRELTPPSEKRLKEHFKPIKKVVQPEAEEEKVQPVQESESLKKRRSSRRKKEDDK